MVGIEAVALNIGALERIVIVRTEAGDGCYSVRIGGIGAKVAEQLHFFADKMPFLVSCNRQIEFHTQ